MEPWDVAKPIISALVGTGAFGALYKFHIVDRISRLEREKDTLVERYEKVIIGLRVEAEQRENRCLGEKQELERALRELQARWEKDIIKVADAYMHPRDAGERPPTTDQILSEVWGDDTKGRDLKRQILDAYLGEALRQYNESTPPRPALDSSNMGSRVAVIIDDNYPMLKALKSTLRRYLPKGWEIVGASDPTVGKSVLIADPRVKVALVDYLLGQGQFGDDLIDEVLKARPNLRGHIIVVSHADYPEDVRRRLFEELGCLRWGKEDTLENLQKLVRKAIT